MLLGLEVSLMCVHEDGLEAIPRRTCKPLGELGFPLESGQPWPQL